MNSRTAIVTGASQGVGLAVSRMLLSEGYSVTAIFNHTTPPLEHNNLTWVQADLSDEQGCDALGQALTASHTRVDALIHCAGVAKLGHIRDTSRTDWEWHMACNLHAPVQLTTMLLPQLRAANGHVIYINSGAGQHANPNWAGYSASKHAARVWCDILRQEEPEIRVTSIYPGRIDTQMQRNIVAQENKEYDPSLFLTPDDVAKATQHCLSTPSHVATPDFSVRPRG